MQIASGLNASLMPNPSKGSYHHRLRYKHVRSSTVHELEKHLGKLIGKAIGPSTPLYASSIRVSLINEFWNVRIIDFTICSCTWIYWCLGLSFIFMHCRIWRISSFSVSSQSFYQNKRPGEQPVSLLWAEMAENCYRALEALSAGVSMQSHLWILDLWSSISHSSLRGNQHYYLRKTWAHRIYICIRRFSKGFSNRFWIDGIPAGFLLGTDSHLNSQSSNIICISWNSRYMTANKPFLRVLFTSRCHVRHINLKSFKQHLRTQFLVVS